MQAACSNFLAEGGIALAPLKNLLDHAAATCPPLAARASCSDTTEFDSYAQQVTAECCDDKSESCRGGLPVSCNARCSLVLLPMQAACMDYLDAGGEALAQTKALLASAASMCNADLIEGVPHDREANCATFCAAGSPHTVTCEAWGCYDEAVGGGGYGDGYGGGH